MTFQFDDPESGLSATINTDGMLLQEIAFTSTLFADVIEDVAEYCGIEKTASEFSKQLSEQMVACAKEMNLDLHFTAPKTDSDDLIHTLVFHDISTEVPGVQSIFDCVTEYADKYMSLMHTILLRAKKQLLDAQI